MAPAVGEVEKNCGKFMPPYDVQTMLFMNVTTTSTTLSTYTIWAWGVYLLLYLVHSSFSPSFVSV